LLVVLLLLLMALVELVEFQDPVKSANRPVEQTQPAVGELSVELCTLIHVDRAAFHLFGQWELLYLL
jgi:hypothetical protein